MANAATNPVCPNHRQAACQVETNPFPPLREEVFNTLTHGIGFLLSLAGAYWLLSLSWRVGTLWHVAGCAVFSATMVVLYAASTLYHGVQRRPAKDLFRLIDHVCIYLLIAGTYTPFTLIAGGAWGWTVLTLVWLFSLTGMALKIAYAQRIDTMSYLPYIAIGWLALVAAKPILEIFPTGTILWILAGGICYTVGVIFVVKDRIRYFHAVWHLFVLAGSACHFYAVTTFVRTF